ncbi:hypothetical protein ACWDYJ_32530 [Streptomyces sp. NPDC003042]
MSTALMYDRAFRERAERRQMWGAGLLFVAVLMWAWLAYLLLAPFIVSEGSGNEKECDSRVFYDKEDPYEAYGYAKAEGGRCDAARDPAGMLALMLLSLPFAAAGVHQHSSATTALRMSAHAAEVARLEGLAASDR